MAQLGDITATLVANIKDFEAKMNKASADVDRMTGGAVEGSSKVGKALGAIGGAAVIAGTAVAGAFATISKVGISVAGDLESARQGFVALLGSAEDADAVMERIKIEAKKTPFEMQGLTAGAQALTAITKDGNKAIDVLLNVGKAVAVSGKGQEELNRVIFNLQQISATGKVMEIDIRQFQNAIPVFNDILELSGLTTEELKNSKNSAQLLFDAFEKYGTEGVGAQGFAAQAGTWNQLVSNMKDTWQIFASDFVKDAGIFDFAKDKVALMTSGLEKLGAILKMFITGDYTADIGEILGVNEDSDLVTKIFQLRNFIVGIPDWFNNIMNSDFVQSAIPVFTAIWEGIKVGAEAFKNTVETVWNTVVEIWNNFVKPAFEELKNTLMEVFGKSASEGMEFQDVMKVVGEGLGYVIGGVMIVLTTLIGVIAKVINWAGQMSMKTKETTDKIATTFSDFWNNKIKPIIDAIWKVTKWLIDAWKWQWDNVVSPLLQIIWAGIAWLGDKIAWIIKWLVDNIISPIQKWMWDKIVKPIKEYIDAIIFLINDLKARISAVWNGIKGDVERIGRSILEAIVKPFRDAKAKIESIAQSIKDAANKINPFYKESPSLVENVRKGVGIIADEYSKLANMGFDSVNNISASGSGLAGSINLSIDMAGANISSPEVAQDYAEKIGDAIIGKLRTTRRSYG